MSAMASQITGILIVPFVQTQIKENIKAPRHCPLWGEFTGTGEFPSRKTSHAENVSIWWRHLQDPASPRLFHVPCRSQQGCGTDYVSPIWRAARSNGDMSPFGVLLCLCHTSNGSWCMGIKGEMSGTVCVTFTWYMYIYELFIAFVCFVVCSLL